MCSIIYSNVPEFVYFIKKSLIFGSSSSEILVALHRTIRHNEILNVENNQKGTVTTIKGHRQRYFNEQGLDG